MRVQGPVRVSPVDRFSNTTSGSGFVTRVRSESHDRNCPTVSTSDPSKIPPTKDVSTPISVDPFVGFE